MDGHPEPLDTALKSGLPAGVALGDALSLLFTSGRTGRLSAHERDGFPLEVWLEQGRVVHAEWGALRDLSALEMAALLPVRTDLGFVDGERTQNQTLDLSAIDVAARLAEVSRAGSKLGSSIPGIEAVPHQTGHRPRTLDPYAARVLEQVDGTRSVADLTAGRQPLSVVRALSSLLGHGAVSFALPHTAAAPPAVIEDAPIDAPPEPPPSEVTRPAAAALEIPATLEPPEPLEPPETPEPPLGPPETGEPSETPAGETSDVRAAPRRFPANIGLAALALAIGVVVVWFAIQRQTSESPPAATIAVTLAPTAQPTAAAAPPPAVAPTSAPAAAPTVAPTSPPQAGVPTSAPTVAPTSPPAAAAPTSAPAAAPTSPPVAAPTVAPTSPPAAAATTSAPTVAPTSPPAAAAPSSAPTSPPAAAPSAAPLLDDTFATSDEGWPNAASSSTFWDPSGYHLVPRIASQFVALTAPSSPTFTNGSVIGLFRKLAGPVGGGYGLILRAQAPLDGSNQGGRYYVFEVGDRGEVGAWRREQDQWIDLQPWKSSEAVHAGDAENRLEVRAAGSQFTFLVNDTSVAQVSDATLSSGAVGVFTGGDGNQVQLERFTVTNQ
ncbi:MAG: DUF4388 domain-containing protein [Chloroflexi bacterium]|nr:DUF4388 domain-containing protein [Chloroflexota bacterium]